LEEIEEEDEEDIPEDEAEQGNRQLNGSGYSPADGLLGDTAANANERTPLVGGPQRGAPHRSMSRGMSASRRRGRSASVAHKGEATVTQAVLMVGVVDTQQIERILTCSQLVKGFVGTGILFLGKAFMNGGILFSVLVLSFIALVSLYSFLLLVRAKFVVSGSFGDIGGALYGPWMRYAILTSIVVSQMGFVCAYIIFVSENLQVSLLSIFERGCMLTL
jgi:proton-coupled amino acid transporter